MKIGRNDPCPCGSGQKYNRCFVLELPDLVSSERWLDGWLLSDAVDSLIKAPRLGNAFLFHMFGFGVDAWQRDVRAVQDVKFRELDLDPDRIRAHLASPLQEHRRAAVAADSAPETSGAVQPNRGLMQPELPLSEPTESKDALA